MVSPDTIDYHGHTIKLSRSYTDYDDYKDDPNNIPKSEWAEVDKLVANQPASKQCATLVDVIAACSDIDFPGYGTGSLAGGPGNPPEYYGSSIELPNADKERYILYRQDSSHYDLVDDFVLPDSSGMIFRVSQESGQLVYRDMQGNIVLRRKPMG